MAVNGLLMFVYNHNVQPLDRLIDIVFTQIECLKWWIPNNHTEQHKKSRQCPATNSVTFMISLYAIIHAKFITIWTETNWKDEWMSHTIEPNGIGGNKMNVKKNHKQTKEPFNKLFLPQSITKECARSTTEPCLNGWRENSKNKPHNNKPLILCGVASFGLFAAHFVFILSALGNAKLLLLPLLLPIFIGSLSLSLQTAIKRAVDAI